MNPPDAGGGAYPRALYLHVPFCRERCAYCDFESTALARASVSPHAYVRGLRRLLGELAERGSFAGLRTAYLGGGTPTVLGWDLPRLVGLVASLAPHPLAELTFEANPESASPDLLRAAREAGATRVSVGVQSTDDAVLARLGRLHDARRALGALREAARLGLRVSADLMAGCPGQRPGSLERDVARVVESGATHVSVYALEVHPQTPFALLEADGRLDAPDEDATANLLEEAAQALARAGLRRYEVSSYAMPGEESLHNLAYWESEPYLGLGPKAASMLPEGDGGRRRLTCTSSAKTIASASTCHDLSFEIERLSEREAVAEDLMLAARLSRGIGPELGERAREAFGASFARTTARLEELGLLEASGGALRPTERGWLMGNELYGALWDLACA